MGGYLHTVSQGEFLAAIGARYGFPNVAAIWDHPKNSALRAMRQDPNVLHPGDELYIPEPQMKTEHRPTDARHRFVIARSAAKVRLALLDSQGKPRANVPCTVEMAGKSAELTSDGSGIVECEIPLGPADGHILVQGVQRALRVAHLDPASEATGQSARLRNLGYLLSADSFPDEPAFRMAVEEFQCDHGLTVDGDCGPKTQAKLLQVHGC